MFDVACAKSETEIFRAQRVSVGDPHFAYLLAIREQPALST